MSEGNRTLLLFLTLGIAASLQAQQSCTNPVLISIETKAGHGAGKPTDMIISEQADKWSFLFWNMGIDYK